MLTGVHQNFVGLVLFGLLCWLLWICTVLYFPPSGGWVVALFYTLTFAAVFCTFAPLQMFVRSRLGFEQTSSRTGALRQSLLMSVFVLAVLYLQSENLLFWWVGVSLALFIICFEIFVNL